MSSSYKNFCHLRECEDIIESETIATVPLEFLPSAWSHFNMTLYVIPLYSFTRKLPEHADYVHTNKRRRVDGQSRDDNK